MAGKEFKARSRTVRKMSRDGLTEEDLRTGESRRITNDREGIRIGDRPMDLYADREIPPDDPASGKPARMDRRAMREGNDPRQSAPGAPPSRPGEAPDKSGSRKKRQARRREASSAEAPSSSALSPGKESAASLTEAGPDRADTKPGSGSRIRDSREDPFRPSPARSSKAPAPAGLRAEGQGDTDRESRRKQTNRRSAARFRRENGLFMENSGDGNGAAPGRGAIPPGQDPQAADTYAPSEEGHRDAAAEEEKENGVREGNVRSSSGRLQQTRGHPSGKSPARGSPRRAGTLTHEGSRKPDPSPEDAAAGKRTRLRETSSGLDGLDALKDEIRQKQKKERLNHEQRKAQSDPRLSFGDESGMVKGSGTGFSRKPLPPAAGAAVGAAKAVTGTAGAATDKKLSEAETKEDNAGLQAAHDAGRTADSSIRAAASRMSRSSGRRGKNSRRREEGSRGERLQFGAEESIIPDLDAFGQEGRKNPRAEARTQARKKAAVRKFLRKQRQQRIYAAAKKEEKTVETVIRSQQNFLSKAAAVVREAVVRNSGVLIVLGIAGVVFLMVSTSLGSCTALLQGAGHTMISTTYPSTDEDIYAVENRYRELEAGLSAQVGRMRQAHPGYDEFRYQIDEITHNPYHLISYFTSKYGQFTYEQVKDEIEEIFREQYSLETTGEENITVTETRTVHPGESLGEVVTSGYCSCEICCRPYAGGPTASGVYPLSSHTIAVDANEPFVPMGTHVIMNGIEYVVEDTGAFGGYGVQFDVYYDDHQTALQHGHQTWEATLAEGGGIEELELTTTRTINRMSVVLTNHDLDKVLQDRMTEAEKVRYALYNATYGNRDYLFDLNSLPRYGNASRDYTIPPEALSDERFARMIAEAERHLGTPYVWGGYSPGGFDCSGFVCWVVNHCGNGWDIGRTDAEGIRQKCYYVSPEDAKPGDIIFFEHTYETAGASHVGIYVGDGMMIHCGEPVQYTSINASYWQDHFMEFGRLP